MSRFTWATVTALSPLRVKLDGTDTSALPITPDSLIDPATLAVGNRVRCELSDSNHVIVLGRSNGGSFIKPNLIINGGLRTNQDAYVSGTSIPIGTYAFDGWKASGVVNLIPNSSFEGAAPTAINCTATKDNTWSQIGSNSAKLVGTGNGDSSITFGENVALSTFGLVIGKTYTLSGYCKVITVTSGAGPTPAARTRALMIQFAGPGTEYQSTQAVNTAGTITRASVTFTVPSGSTGVYLRAYLGGAAGTVQWDALVLTEGPILYPAFDGNTTDCSFAGTANASFSYNVPNVVPTLTGTFDPNFGSFFTINANARITQIVERSRAAAGSTITVNGGTAQTRVYNNLTAPGSRPAWTTGPVTFVADGTDDVIVEAFGGGAGATIGQVRMFAGATDFGFSLPTIGDELRDCWRYFLRWASSLAAGGQRFPGTVIITGTTTLEAQIATPVQMRTIPQVLMNNICVTDAVSANSSALTPVLNYWQTFPQVANVVQFSAAWTTVTFSGATPRQGMFAMIGSGPSSLALDARIR